MNEIRTIEGFISTLPHRKEANVVEIDDYQSIQRVKKFKEMVFEVIREGYSIDELNGKILSIADRIFRKGSTHQELERMTKDFIIGVMEELGKLEQACQFKPEIAAIIGEALYIARDNFPELIEFIQKEGTDINDSENHKYFVIGMYQYILNQKEQLSQESGVA